MVSVMIGMFAAVPTVLVIVDYAMSRRINWILLILWFIIMALAISFSEGRGKS